MIQYNVSNVFKGMRSILKINVFCALKILILIKWKNNAFVMKIWLWLEIKNVFVMASLRIKFVNLVKTTVLNVKIIKGVMNVSRVFTISMETAYKIVLMVSNLLMENVWETKSK